MRTLLLAFVGALCLVLPAQAQVEPQHRGILKKLPPVDKDVLFRNIRVDMPVSELRQFAELGRWTLREETTHSLQYETEPVRPEPQRFPYSIIATFFFRDGKIHALSVTMRGSIEHEKKVLWGHDIISARLENRADTVQTDGARRVMTHVTSDGRTMRVVWNQVSTIHAEIEAAVVSSGEAFLPLR